jgi:F-type H+-transporting ATPase subunit alpha
LAQFRELAAFAQFGSDLDKSTQAQLERGRRLTEILKQGQYQPMPVEQQVFIIWTVSNGLADDIEVSDLRRFEEDIFKFIENSHPAVLQTLRDKKSIDDDLKASMREAVEDFKSTRWNQDKIAVANA